MGEPDADWSGPAQLQGLYGQYLQFAFARNTERALSHELGNPELRFLQFGNLTGKQGLPVGEKLYLDVKHKEIVHTRRPVAPASRAIVHHR